jgi:hypothetical protein
MAILLYEEVWETGMGHQEPEWHTNVLFQIPY